MDMDSDTDERDNDNENEVLTGFLFGNIDSKGQLEDDIFDNESKKQLASLARYIKFAYNNNFHWHRFLV